MNIEKWGRKFSDSAIRVAVLAALDQVRWICLVHYYLMDDDISYSIPSTFSFGGVDSLPRTKARVHYALMSLPRVALP